MSIFGDLGASSNFAQFGSLQAGTPIKTKDIASIQSLAAWDNGLQDALYASNKAMLLEDINAWMYLHSYMTAYGLQEGIAEWDAGTTYYINSVVKLPVSLGGSAGVPQLFASVTDANIGNQPPAGTSNAFWTYVNPPPAPPPGPVPTGTILAFAGIALPTGYAWCDGEIDNQSVHPDLYTVLGTSWGNGSGGAGSFNRPDLRGVVLRGINTYGQGTAADGYQDTEAASRGVRHTGGATGDAIGSYMMDASQGHNHSPDGGGQFVNNAGAAPTWGVGGGSVHGYAAVTTGPGNNGYGTPRQGYETRMKNAGVTYIIKT